MTKELTFRTREKHARARAEELNVVLHKHPTRNPQAWGYRQFMIVDGYSNFVLAGSVPVDYMMTIDDVEEWLSSYAGEQNANPDPRQR